MCQAPSEGLDVNPTSAKSFVLCWPQSLPGLHSALGVRQNVGGRVGGWPHFTSGGQRHTLASRAQCPRLHPGCPAQPTSSAQHARAAENPQGAGARALPSPGGVREEGWGPGWGLGKPRPLPSFPLTHLLLRVPIRTQAKATAADLDWQHSGLLPLLGWFFSPSGKAEAASPALAAPP